jgi:hypothetical protein
MWNFEGADRRFIHVVSVVPDSASNRAEATFAYHLKER